MDRPLASLPLSSQIMPVKGHQTLKKERKKRLTKSPGVPAGLIQDVTHKKMRRRSDATITNKAFPLPADCSEWPIAYFVVVMAVAVRLTW